MVLVPGTVRWTFDLRELYGPNSFPVDGIWGAKQQKRLFRILGASSRSPSGDRAVAGTHHLPAETADEFAEAVLRLASEPELAARIATAGWDLCRTKFATNVPGG